MHREDFGSIHFGGVVGGTAEQLLLFGACEDLKVAYIMNAMVCLIFIFLLLIMGVRSGSRSLVVQTREGDIEGIHLPAVQKVRGDVYAFYGVPYGRNTGGTSAFLTAGTGSAAERCDAS
ncbi:hypothetical protein MTO96_051454 [Rhipicephalus appendiculatus]